MGKDDTPLKKRRKLAQSSCITEPTKSTNPVDVYKKSVEFEETEAAQRSADKDADLFHDMCHNIRKILGEIAQLKNENSEESNELIHKKRVEASLIIVALKKLNRLDKVRTKHGREALHKEKQRVDSTHLLLQNLLYEADHLNKEVTKCLQFKSKDEEIDLIPVEQFYGEAPEDIARKESTKADEHQLRLARLEWELRQRRQLSDSCSQLVQSKERVAAAIAATRSRLEALGPHLKDVLKATKPLQECLALRLDEKREESRLAALLPQPLFLLYANCSSYSEAFRNNLLSVSICGDEEEARRFEQTNTVDDNEQSNESESDQDNENEHRSKKKRRHRATKISKEEKAEAKKKRALKKHPLSVQVTVSLKGEVAINIIVSYLLVLRIAVVKSTIDMDKPVTGVSAADLLSGQNLLQTLYAQDAGEDSPHPATEFILKSAGLTTKFSNYVSELGRPFIWAQRMCGLDFMSAILSETKKPIVPCAKVSSAAVEHVVITLKKRLRSQLELMRELQDLESGKIATFDSLPIRISGSLTQWQAVSWAEYSLIPSTKLLVAEELVDSNDLLYRAVITRQSAKLVALVAVKSGYPKKAPIFCLSLHYNGTHSAENDDDIRDIERIVNTGWGIGEDEDVTLTFQITKLLSCLDVLLESMGSSEFPPDKVMLRPVRGRNRAKPYHFLNKGCHMFIHY